MPNPANGRIRSESHNERESAKPIRATPNSAAEDAIQLPRPATVLRAREQHGRRQGSDSGCAHQKAECVRAAVQNAGREDRHQHRVWHAHQADEREQQQQRADRPGLRERTASPPPVRRARWRCGRARSDGRIRIASSDAITAM